MKTQNYTTANCSVTIEVPKSPDDVFGHLTNDVSKFWPEEFEGKSAKINDEFTFTTGDSHYSKNKVVELIPNKKVVWLVTDSTLHWLKEDQHEWTNTKMIFEITTRGDKTVLHFTHEGLVPEKECHAMCKQGWNTVIKDYLFNFISYGKPHFKF